MTLITLANQRSSISVRLVFVLLFIGAFAVLWKVGAADLAPWDEAIYAEVSKEILQRRDWVTLHWEYQPWFEKPPLLMWITALLYGVFGVSELSARLPSALSGIALLGVTYSIGKLTFGRQVGLLAGVILLTCYHFLSFSRFGTMEVMLTLFTYAAIYGYLLVQSDSPKWWFVVWVACALALMVKGAGGLIGPFAILLVLAFDKRAGAINRSRHFWMGCLLALLIVAPWHLLMLIKYGSSFIDEYVGYHVVARSTRALEGHASSYFYYVGKLVDGFFPWCLLVPFALISFVRRNLKDGLGSWVLLVLSGLVFVVYTVIPTRRPWYIVPLYPALAIFIAAFIFNLYQNLSQPIYRRLLMAVFVLLTIFAGLYSLVSLTLNHKGKQSLAELARIARSTDPNDKDSLVLLAGVDPIYAQVALFYSNRPIQQAYVLVEPTNEDAKRYVNYEDLRQVTHASSKRIIIRNEDIQLLSTEYDIRTFAAQESLVLATIKQK